MKTVRVLIYSDQPILAMGLKNVIAADPALELAAYCSEISTLKEELANRNADLAVLDLTPEVTYAMLRVLRNLHPACKLILWTTSIGADFALQAVTVGVRGVLRKTLSLKAHRQCLHRVHGGGLWFEKRLTDSFTVARRVLLSPREGQLVTLLSRGLSNREIAIELGITEGTVKVYLSHLFHKAGAKDRYDLALQGLKNLSLAGVTIERPGGLRSLLMEQTYRQ